MRAPLDLYDDMPSGMKRYISNYGWHFNKAAYEYAASLMKSKNASGNLVNPIVYSKQQVDLLLKKYGIALENTVLYDYVYVAMMCKSDFLGSSISDEQHLAKYVKDVVDDPDASEGTVFRRWLATLVGNGQPVDWDEIV